MNGFFFIASGQKYLEEAVSAIEQVRRVMPNALIAFASDQDVRVDADCLIPIEEPYYNFADKVRYFSKTPFDNTVFLDTDVFVASDISNLFTLLERFEVAAPHAPIEEDELVDVPISFAEPNSGVIAYKKTTNVLNMLSAYEKHYLKALAYYLQKDHEIPPDQPSFRYAIYHSDVNFAFLPHEYNCMIDYPCFLSGKVRILHGHYQKEFMQAKEKMINQTIEIRIYHPDTGISLFKGG